MQHLFQSFIRMSGKSIQGAGYGPLSSYLKTIISGPLQFWPILSNLLKWKDNALLLLEIGLKMHFRFVHRELIRSIHGRKYNSFTNILDKKIALPWVKRPFPVPKTVEPAKSSEISALNFPPVVRLTRTVSLSMYSPHRLTASVISTKSATKNIFRSFFISKNEKKFSKWFFWTKFSEGWYQRSIVSVSKQKKISLGDPKISTKIIFRCWL